MSERQGEYLFSSIRGRDNNRKTQPMPLYVISAKRRKLGAPMPTSFGAQSPIIGANRLELGTSHPRPGVQPPSSGRKGFISRPPASGANLREPDSWSPFSSRPGFSTWLPRLPPCGASASSIQPPTLDAESSASGDRTPTTSASYHKSGVQQSTIDSRRRNSDVRPPSPIVLNESSAGENPDHPTISISRWERSPSTSILWQIQQLISPIKKSLNTKTASTQTSSPVRKTFKDAATQTKKRGGQRRGYIINNYLKNM